MKRLFLLLTIIAASLASNAQCVYQYVGQGNVVYAEYCYGPYGVYPSGNCAFSADGTLTYFCVAPDEPGGQNIISPLNEGDITSDMQMVTLNVYRVDDDNSKKNADRANDVDIVHRL